MDNQTAVLNAAIAKGIGLVKVADQGVALRIRCVAYPESSGHYGDAVVVSATSLTLSVDGVADSTVGSSGVLAFATYTTLGTLVDAINVSSNWQAEIVAGLRSDAINGSELLARSTSTFRMFQEVSLNFDSSDGGVAGIDIALEPGQAFDFVTGSNRPNLHRVDFQRLAALVNTSDSSDTTVYVYELLPAKAAVLRTLASFTVADNVEKDSGLNAPTISADYGNTILVRFRNAAGWADSGAYLKVFGLRT